MESLEKNEEKKFYTYEEVYEHKTEKDLWIVVEQKVYDLSKWIEKHPGGPLPLMAMAGQESTDAFLGYHTKDVYEKYLPSFQIGYLKDDPGDIYRDFQKMRAKMVKDGLFITDLNWYYLNIFLRMILFSIVVLLVIYGNGRLWMYSLAAIGLGMFWQQVALFGHDFGHNSVGYGCKGNSIGSKWVNLFFGVSGQWWKESHNTHHFVCNSIENDPDIQHLPVFAVTDKILNGFFSNFYKREFKFDCFAKNIVRFQHILYFPVMGFARFNFYIQTIGFLLRFKHVPGRFSEIFFIALFWIWVISLLRILPDTYTLVYFLIISHIVTGFLHCQVTISHFAMHTYNDKFYNPSKRDNWIKSQMETTMNIDCYEWMDWFHGGLQFQIEHHLFPNLPRTSLRVAKEQYVIPFCKKHNINYYQYSSYAAVKIVLKKLKSVAKSAENFKALNELFSSLG